MEIVLVFRSIHGASIDGTSRFIPRPAVIPVHIRHLETFYWAARLGSFTGAAERLHATQSTVSVRISELELRFGVALFDRSHRKVRLTAKGEELLVYAERLLHLTSEIQERIARPETVSGLVRVGVAEVVAQSWLPAFVEMLHRRHPKVTARFEVFLTLELMDRLRAGAVDVILSPARLPEPGLAARSLGLVEFRWMAGASLALPPEPLTPTDLEHHRLIALPRESFHYATIEHWFRSNRAIFNPTDVCNSMSVVAALTMAGLGLSLLPPTCVAGEIASGRLRMVETTPALRPVEFFAIRPAEAFAPLSELIAELAVEASRFAAPKDGISRSIGKREPEGSAKVV